MEFKSQQTKKDMVFEFFILFYFLFYLIILFNLAYIYGGSRNDERLVYTDLWRFDFLTEKFECLNVILSMPHTFGTLIYHERQLYLYGGLKYDCKKKNFFILILFFVNFCLIFIFFRWMEKN